MNEWAFAAEVKSWWDAEFGRHPEWGLDRCEVERRVGGSLRRSDLVVLARGAVRLCGEFRLPDRPDSNPWQRGNLVEAAARAVAHGARWAFASDTATLLLLDTKRFGPPAETVALRIRLPKFQRVDATCSEKRLEGYRGAWIAALHTLVSVSSGLRLPAGVGGGRRPKGTWLPMLKERRYDVGLSLQELEEKTVQTGRRVRASTISELENLKRGAHGRTARVLAEALGVGVRELREERGT